MRDKKELIKVAMQFIKFGIVGVFNTGISVGIYYILIHFKVNYIIANTIRICCKCFECILLE